MQFNKYEDINIFWRGVMKKNTFQREFKKLKGQLTNAVLLEKVFCYLWV